MCSSARTRSDAADPVPFPFPCVIASNAAFLRKGRWRWSSNTPRSVPKNLRARWSPEPQAEFTMDLGLWEASCEGCQTWSVLFAFAEGFGVLGGQPEGCSLLYADGLGALEGSKQTSKVLLAYPDGLGS